MEQLDLMLSMGFEAQLLELPGCLPQVRQTAVYTTAWSEKIQCAARQLTKDALSVFKCNESEACVAPDNQISKKLYIEIVQPGFLTNSKF